MLNAALQFWDDDWVDFSKPKYIGLDVIDQYECRCGWKSRPYYDGAEYAYAEWQKHLKSAHLPEQKG